VYFKEVVVDIPDDFKLTETEFNKAVHLKNLSIAEREVEEKRDQLYRAEEVVKNMLAFPAEKTD